MLVKSVADSLNLVKMPTAVSVNCCVSVITDCCGHHCRVAYSTWRLFGPH